MLIAIDTGLPKRGVETTERARFFGLKPEESEEAKNKSSPTTLELDKRPLEEDLYPLANN